MSVSSLDRSLSGQKSDQTDEPANSRFNGIPQSEVEGLVESSDQIRSRDERLRIIDEMFTHYGLEGGNESLRSSLSTSTEHARCDEAFSDFELFRVPICKDGLQQA